MERIFEFNRFKLLVHRIISERGIKLFGSLLFIAFCMLLFLGIGFMKPSIYETARSFFVTVGLFLGPISYMWILSSEYQTNSQSISFLMLPGSTFEKWLAHMVIGVGIYYLSFLVIFRLLDLFFVSAIHSKYDSTGISYIVKDMEIQSFDSLLLYGPFLLGTIISLSVFIGALYFKKNSLVYSLITVFSLAMAIVVYHFVIISLNLDGNIPIDGRSAIPFYRVLITDVSSSPAKEYVIGSKYSITSVLSAMCIPIICALTIAYYYAIKEKEL